MAIIPIEKAVLPNVGVLLYQSIAAAQMNIRRVGEFVQEGIRKFTPHGTGFASGKCRVLKHWITGRSAGVQVGWKKSDFPRGKFYAVYLGEGTGIYGKGRKKIEPKRKGNKANLLRYQWNGNWVSIRSSRGQKPHDMLERGYNWARPKIFALLSRTMFKHITAYKRA